MMNEKRQNDGGIEYVGIVVTGLVVFGLCFILMSWINSVAGREIAQLIRDTAVAVNWTIKIGAIVVATGLVGSLFWASWWAAEFVWGMKSDRHYRDAEAAVLTKESMITVAGNQVFMHRFLPDGSIDVAPLHLLPPSQQTVLMAGSDGVDVWRTFHALNQAPPNIRVNRMEGGWGAGLPAQQLPAPSYPLPSTVNLMDYLRGGQGDLNNIVLGVRATPNGIVPVSAPLESLVHVALGGETGTGKSTMAYALAYQIATAAGQVEMVLADLAGTTWKTMSSCGKLKWQPISEVDELIAALSELLAETERRTNIVFAPYPTVEKLSDYNALVGPDQQLGYVTVFIDEFPEFLQDPTVAQLVKRLVRKSRKAGFTSLGWVSVGRRPTSIPVSGVSS